MSAVSKAMYLPLSMATSLGAGLLAGALFSQVWKRIDDADQGPPDAKDLTRSGRDAVLAAALHGVVFGVVRALVDRAGARGYRAVTHRNPV